MVQGWGWYLYGIIEQQPMDSWDDGASLRQDSDEIQLLQDAGVAAVVRSVPVADYQPETIRAHMHDAYWLEVMATHHHSVIESIHRRRPILPATFGCVYADEAGLRAGLSDLHETLRTRLHWIAECDEWTVRLYGDAASLSRRLTQEHPRLQVLQHEIDSVASGRAYLLKRKFAHELSSVMAQATAQYADDAYSQISHTSRSSMLQARKITLDEQHGEVEILRAVFLVPRSDLTAFLRDAEVAAWHDAGIRGEYSGPWPPYSFAQLEVERLGA